VYLTLAQSADELFREARRKAEVDADIPAAIQIYERIVRDFPTNRALVAQSLFQLGESYERLNQPTKSREYFQRIVDQFKDQSDIYTRATARLAPAADRTKRIEIKTPFSGGAGAFALSPDGKTFVAFVSPNSVGQLWLYHMDSGRSELLPGTEDPRTGGPHQLFFSPDSRVVGFFAEGKLKTFDLQSRTVRILAAATWPAGGTWGADDLIVFSSLINSPLKSVSSRVENGPVQSLVSAVGSPHFLPDGHRFLFYGRNGSTTVLKIGSVENSDVQTLSVMGPSAASFVSPDRLFYTTSRGTLIFQKFDPSTLQVVGNPERLAENVATYGINNGEGAFSASAAGPVAFRTSLVATRQFTWWDRKGQRLGPAGPLDKEEPGFFRFSPGGQAILYTRQSPVGDSGPFLGITELDLATGRLRGMNTSCFRPVPSPDGESLACNASQTAQGRGAFNLFVHTIGAGTKAMRPPAQGFNPPVDWSSDGKFVLYQYYDADFSGNSDLLAQPVAGGDPIPVATTTSAFERSGRFSPNSQWVAYDSYESGKGYEVYIQPFPGTTASRVKVSVNGGYDPQWSRDGKELYFLSSDNHLMVVPVTFSADGKELKHGTAALLFQTALPPGSEYAPAPDGQRFLINAPTEDLPPIIVLSNWEAK